MRQRFITTILFLILTANIFAQPRWGDTFWRDSVPETMRKDYIRFGEQYKNKEWHSLPAATFAEFKKTGNRTNYEGLLFEKRRHWLPWFWLKSLRASAGSCLTLSTACKAPWKRHGGDCLLITRLRCRAQKTRPLTSSMLRRRHS